MNRENLPPYGVAVYLLLSKGNGAHAAFIKSERKSTDVRGHHFDAEEPYDLIVNDDGISSLSGHPPTRASFDHWNIEAWVEAPFPRLVLKNWRNASALPQVSDVFHTDP